MKGIYGYYDTKNKEIIYIGKDSHIDKQIRHKAHFKPSTYTEQPINKVLQNNPQRYEYVQLCLLPKNASDDDLNKLEIERIIHLNPKFNFTKGGEGIFGFKFSEESKQKISNSLKGSTYPLERNIKISKHHGTTGIYRVYIRKNKKLSQGYYWEYSWFENGKRRYISRTDFSKLKEEVLKQGLDWIILDNTKYEKTMQEYGSKTPKIKKKLLGLDAPHAKYKLWDITKTHYVKSMMTRNGRTPNPVRCFRLKWNNNAITIGGFLEFVSIELIYDLIKEETAKRRCD